MKDIPETCCVHTKLDIYVVITGKIIVLSRDYYRQHKLHNNIREPSWS